MIGKRIRRDARQPRASRASIARSVGVLARYVMAANPGTDHGPVESLVGYVTCVHEPGPAAGDKAIAVGAFNLLGDNIRIWEGQMQAAADQCVRGRDPLEHFVLSWQAGEQPTAEQANEAVAIVLKQLGYDHCPTIWSIHADTSNLHVHIAVVRYDLQTGRMAGRGWDIDALHQSLALIEHRQGWSVEKDACFEVRDNALFNRRTAEQVQRLETSDILPRSRRASKQPPVDPELEALTACLTGALAACASWPEFHRQLAADGLRYERAGSGAKIFKGAADWKASQAGPEFAWAKVVAKLGPHQPDPALNPAGYEIYLASWRERLQLLRTAQHAARERLEKDRRRDRAIITAILAERGLVSDTRAIVLAAIDAEIEAARQAIDAEFKRAKAELAATRLTPDKWFIQGQPLSTQVACLPRIFFPMVVRAEPNTAFAGLADPEEVFQWATAYQNAAGDPSFTDHRRVIIVHQSEHAVIAAALALAAARWSSIAVAGDAAFLTICAQVAAERGLSLTYPAHLPTPQVGKTSSPTRKSVPMPTTVAQPQEPETALPQEALSSTHDHYNGLASIRRRWQSDLEFYEIQRIEIVRETNEAGLASYRIANQSDYGKANFATIARSIDVSVGLERLYTIQQSERAKVLDFVLNHNVQLISVGVPFLPAMPEALHDLIERWYTTPEIQAALADKREVNRARRPETTKPDLPAEAPDLPAEAPNPNLYGYDMQELARAFRSRGRSIE